MTTNFNECIPLNDNIFARIYQNNYWGGDKGDFFSGSGSHNEYITEFCVATSDFIVENKINSIVEIGCGDFFVTNQVLNNLELSGINFNYVGVDIVAPLIERNTAIFGSDKITFQFKDPINEIIPKGDLLIIRQVLQHLDNNSISKILSLFGSYRYIMVTEHQISERYKNMITPNLDKVSGYSNRIPAYSGVYLDFPPFNCKVTKLFYTIPEAQQGIEAFINTFLIINGI